MLTIAAVIIYNVVEFFKAPDAILKIINFILGMGLCLGAGILFLFLLFIISTICTKFNERIIFRSNGYQVRCHATKMKKVLPDEPIPDDLSEENGQDIKIPIFANMVVTNYGIWFMQKKDKPVKVLGEAASTLPDKSFDPYLMDSIIRVNDFKLYYLPYRSEGSLEFEHGQANSNGFTDERINIVVVFRAVSEANKLKETTRLEQPIKLKFLALNKNGDNDLMATATLYRAILQLIIDSAPTEDDDDDSWMYHSRPIYW